LPMFAHELSDELIVCVCHIHFVLNM
jgi:hypothetical protein